MIGRRALLGLGASLLGLVVGGSRASETTPTTLAPPRPMRLTFRYGADGKGCALTGQEMDDNFRTLAEHMEEMRLAFHELAVASRDAGVKIDRMREVFERMETP